MNNKKSKKIISFGTSLIVPKFIKNIYLMIKFNCIIHPSANIAFLKNLSIGKVSIIGKCDIYAQGPVEIGKNCLINDFVILNSKTGYIKIGDNTSINHFTVIFGNGGVEIGKNNAIAQSVKIINNHLIPTQKNVSYDEISEKKTIINDYVWISANVVIVDGITIGDNSIIGANSFVNSDVPSNVIAVGTPIRVIKERNYE